MFCITVNCATSQPCILTTNVGKPETIVWKNNVGNKLLDWDPDNNIQWYPQLRNRADLNTETGALTITAVRKTDSGVYKSEIQVAGKIKNIEYDLRVMGKCVFMQIHTHLSFVMWYTRHPMAAK